MERIVVVGAGEAGASLVAKLRSLGHDGPITLIGNEPVLPYERPPLSTGISWASWSRYGSISPRLILFGKHDGVLASIC